MPVKPFPYKVVVYDLGEPPKPLYTHEFHNLRTAMHAFANRVHRFQRHPVKVHQGSHTCCIWRPQ